MQIPRNPLLKVSWLGENPLLKATSVFWPDSEVPPPKTEVPPSSPQKNRFEGPFNRCFGAINWILRQATEVLFVSRPGIR